MNTTLLRTRSGQKAGLPLVVAAFAVLLALAAGGIWKATDLRTGTIAEHQSRLNITRSYPTLELYVVDSDAQHDMVMAGEAQAEQERALNGIADPGYQVVILKATTPEEEQNVAEVLDSWTGWSFSLRSSIPRLSLHPMTLWR